MKIQGPIAAVVAIASIFFASQAVQAVGILEPSQHGLTLSSHRIASIVDLSSFDIYREWTTVTVGWETRSEVGNDGFNLWRSKEGEEGYERVNSRPISGKGGDSSGALYSFEDQGVAVDETYYYKLEAVDVLGRSTFHGPIAAMAAGACGTLASGPAIGNSFVGAAFLLLFVLALNVGRWVIRRDFR